LYRPVLPAFQWIVKDLKAKQKSLASRKIGMYFFATMMPSFTIAAAQPSSVKGTIAANVQIHTKTCRRLAWPCY
jgi:hypothetical protein